MRTLYIAIVAALLAPASAVAQSADGFGSGDEWRAYVNELCRTGKAGPGVGNSMFGVAVRVGTEAARQYCDCYASEMAATAAERGANWGTRDNLPRGFPKWAKSANRTCFEPYDDGQRFSLRTLTHDQRQAILDALAEP